MHSTRVIFGILIFMNCFFIASNAMDNTSQQSRCSFVGRLIDRVRRPSIMRAAQKGYYHQLGALLIQGEYADKTDNQGLTPLMHAAAGGHLDCVKLLIEHKVSLTQKDDQGFTPFLWASFTGKEYVMRTLYELDMSVVNDQDNDGHTALIWAGQHNQHYLIKFLMEIGSDPNKRDNKGWTALMHAADNGWQDSFDQLILVGANFQLRDKHGKSAFDIANTKNYKKIGHILALRKALIAQEILADTAITQASINHITSQQYAEYQAVTLNKFVVAHQKKSVNGKMPTKKR